MRIINVEITNFRSIRNMSLTLSPFTCVIGHNNAGKSTLLMALTLFRSGSSIKPTDFYDKSSPTSIRVTFDGVTQSVLSTLTVEQATRISEIVVDGRLILVRRYGTDGRSELLCVRRLPIDNRYSDAFLSDALKNKRGASQLCQVLKENFPEHGEEIEAKRPSKIGDAKELIGDLAKLLPESSFSDQEASLPTGIPQSVERLLPEVLYIPAVKDVSDELKTKEASSFGKVIKVLLDMVHEADELQNVRESFSKLDALLNRSVNENGQMVDERLSDVRKIERYLEKYIREQFRSVNVELKIPPPDLKAVFSNARIFLNDGVITEVEGKGDGLKRAVLFALLRTFVELQQERSDARALPSTITDSRYLFLFEEPELYLHPNSQRILYDALRQISEHHQVCVSTHSPYFFSAEPSGTYIRLRKVVSSDGQTPPYCEPLSVDLSSSATVKDAFQIICFENSNAAFFCDRVLLVEGDCDVIYMKHLALMLDASWNFDRRNMAVVKVGGKGSFARYREFFQSFDVDVRIVADLDAIADQFEKLGASETTKQLRATLIQEAHKILQNQSVTDPSRSQIKDMVRRMSFREKYASCKALAAKAANGEGLAKEEAELFCELFSEETAIGVREIIQTSPELSGKKAAVINALRSEGIVVLSKGAIEDYYPDGVQGDDKPSRALHACQLVSSREHVLSLSEAVVGGQ